VHASFPNEGWKALLLKWSGFMHFRFGLTTLTLLLAFGTEAAAGPPFITDDPEPTDTGHWEIYNFAKGTWALGVATGQGGFDINAVLPADFEQAAKVRLGLGNIELAAKYRFLHQSDNIMIPDVAFFPAVIVPVANRHFGSGRLGLFLPLWAEKDFGAWSLFGGGGYNINPGTDQRNFWLSGVTLQRTITDRLSLGIEVYHQTPDAIDAKPFTGINLGIGGPGIENASEGGRFDLYVALKSGY